MRAYLLGTLADREAAALEDRYVSSRAVFHEVRAIERALIQDYLRDRLPEADRLRFENRYLKVPQLQRRLNEVRAEFAAADADVPQMAWLGWPQVLAVVALLCVVGTGVWMNARSQSSQARRAEIKPPIFAVSILVRLSPGIVKGSNGGIAAFEIPPAGSVIRFVLELPGESSPILCRATISAVGPDGQWNRIWTLNHSVRSEPVRTGQELTFEVDSSLLHAQDYILQVVTPDDHVRESYAFHVIERH